MTRKRAKEREPGSESAQSGNAASATHSANPGEPAHLRTRSQELEESNAELRRLIEYRSRFLARLAHELRNPLTSILGFAEILLNHEKLTTGQEEFCRKIQNSALQIQGSFNQLADLARLDLGGGSLRRGSARGSLRGGSGRGSLRGGVLGWLRGSTRG